MAATAAEKKATAIVEKLNAPTPKEAILSRPGKGKSGALSYVTARYVMERLDDAVGPFGWTDTYRETDGGVVCTISITLDGEVWVPKSDVGTPSNIEGIKGKFSDAFKRAAVKWGIGRDLYEDYTIPAEPAPEPKSKKVDADHPDYERPKVVGGSGLSQKQKGLLFARWKEAGIAGDQRKAFLFFVCGKHSTKEMDGADMDKAIEFLDKPDPDVMENIKLASAEKS
jgi:hypothetical protein